MLTSYSQNRVYKASQHNTSNYNLYCLIGVDKLLRNTDVKLDNNKVISCCVELSKRYNTLSCSFSYKDSKLVCNTKMEMFPMRTLIVLIKSSI
jgi:hypothetical protein